MLLRCQWILEEDTRRNAPREKLSWLTNVINGRESRAAKNKTNTTIKPLTTAFVERKLALIGLRSEFRLSTIGSIDCFSLRPTFSPVLT